MYTSVLMRLEQKSKQVGGSAGSTELQTGRAGQTAGLPGDTPTQPAQGPAHRAVDRGNTIVAYYLDFCNNFIQKLMYLYTYEN